MALEHQSAQTQQGSTVVASVVKTALHGTEHRIGHQCRELGENIFGKLGLQEAADHRGQALAGLEGHVAHKTVADHDINHALEDVIAFDIAVEVQVACGTCRAQQLTGLLDDFIALDGFFTNVEQTHRGRFPVLQHGDQGRPHHGKLQQMLCGAVHVGAQVQHRGGAARVVGNLAGNGGALNAIQRLEHIA